MPIDEIAGEAIGRAAGFVVREAGGLVVDLVFDQIFSRHSARFFHGVGRRVIAILTLGRKRIPSSLRAVPRNHRARPRTGDWLALWVGIVSWLISFLAIGLSVAALLG